MREGRTEGKEVLGVLKNSWRLGGGCLGLEGALGMTMKHVTG